MFGILRVKWIYLVGLSIVSLWASVGRSIDRVPIESIAKWDFSPAEDVNYDGWPDEWRRRSGRGFPAYLNFNITPYSNDLELLAKKADIELLGFWRLLGKFTTVSEQLPVSWVELSDHYLRIEMNGGAAWLESPKFPVSHDFSYFLRFRGMTEGLKLDRAWGELVFYNDANEEIGVFPSRQLSETTAWQSLTVGPMATPMQSSAVAVRLRVEAKSRPDISGAAGFDRIELRRLPQLTMDFDDPAAVYAQGTKPKLMCRLSGLSAQGADLKLSLLNVHGQVLHEQTLPAHLGEPGDDGFRSGTVQWQPPIEDSGWYEVRAQLTGADVSTMESSITCAVLGELPPSTPGPFGFSFSESITAIPIQRQPSWFSELQAGWVKFPCWLPPNNREASDNMAWLMERLADRGIQSVGVLGEPPAEIRPRFPGSGPLPAAALFREIDLWQPLLESQMSRLSLRVGWWQIGRDDDFSFSELANPAASLTAIRNGLQGFGQPVSVVAPWPLLDPPPPNAESPGWNAVAITDDIPTTAREITSFVDSQPDSPRKNWFVLNPLPKSVYSLEMRVRDLVERMVAVRKTNSVTAVFTTNTIDRDQGLILPAGTPTEMLLPWRTTAGLIGHLNHLGSLQLSGRSENVLLAKEKQGVLVVWNHVPTEESVHLGDELVQYDVWGNRQQLKKLPDGRNVFTAGPWPTFLTGVDTRLMQWRLSVSLEPDRIESLLGRKQSIEVIVRNPTSSPATGQLRPLGPESWQLEAASSIFSIEPGGTARIPLSIVLRPNASIGTSEMGLDFTIDSERQFRFTVNRNLSIGPSDLEMDITTSLDLKGRLFVQQEFINSGSKTYRLDSYLFLPGRQRDRTPYLLVPPGERVLKSYVIENGQELVGKDLLVTIEEIESERRMNYRRRITP